jgi:MFS family permease
LFLLKEIGMSFITKEKSVALYAALVSFGTYVFIFGFRKSFTVCTFEGMTFGPIAFKTAMVISQMLGYLMAKFYGIQFISGLEKKNRYKIIFLLTGIAWAAWLLFAIVPAPYSILFLFINGFPLGMLWGVVFSYVEGRRSTDFIGAALAVSFIFSAGWVKSVGAWLMLHFNITETWVPFCTGLVFALPLVLCVWGLEQVPAPSKEDEALRAKRIPMTGADRRLILKQYLPGVIAFIAIYLFATIFRDIRDNFSADMWKEMGYTAKPSTFSETEIPITIFILILIGAVVAVKNSFKAFMIAHVFILIGFVVAGLSTYFFTQKLVDPFWWMLLVGLGLYLVYIPFNSIYFDRLIAAYSIKGNAGFFIYLADSIGYVGSVTVMLVKEGMTLEIEWTSFFAQSVMILSFVGLFITAYAMYYFASKSRMTPLIQ